MSPDGVKFRGTMVDISTGKKAAVIGGDALKFKVLRKAGGYKPVGPAIPDPYREPRQPLQSLSCLAARPWL